MKPQREQISALRDGAMASVPLLVGIVPWGIVAGVAMVSAGLTQAQAVAMSVLVFAGSAQLAVLPLLVAKAPLWVMYATALVVNLRYVIYSAVLAPYFEQLSKRWRALLSYITVDQTFALFVGKYAADAEKATRHWFFFGASLMMWTCWQTASLIGVLMPLLQDRAIVCAALAGGGVALATAKWPLNLGLLAAIAAGVAVGLSVSRASARKAGRA